MCKKHLSLFKIAGRGCVEHANQPDDVLLQYNNPEAVQGEKCSSSEFSIELGAK